MQEKLSYADILQKLQPDYVVHGDDWIQGVQKPIREEVIGILEKKLESIIKTSKEIK